VATTKPTRDNLPPLDATDGTSRLDHLGDFLEQISAPDPIDRRGFLSRVVQLAAVLGMTSPIQQALAKTASTAISYDIQYFASRDVSDVLDYMDDLESVLGPEVSRELQVVQYSSGMYAVVYNRNADAKSCSATAKRHSKLLTDSDLEPATIAKGTDYEQVYNISFGTGSNLGALKSKFRTVSRLLGPELTEDLVIEKTKGGHFALVYKRFGDLASSQDIATRYRTKLNGAGIDVSWIAERNNDQIYGRSSETSATEVEPEVEKRSKSHAIRPQREATRPIRTQHSTLESRVERLLSQRRHEGKISPDESTAFVAYDLNSGNKLISINEDRPMQAASMIKVYIALGILHKASHGTLRYDQQTKRMMERMIQKSSNTAANWCLRKVGGPHALQELIDKHYDSILSSTHVAEYIPPGGKAYRNVSSAHDYSRFLFALWHGDLPRSSELMRLMALPGRDRIKCRAHSIPASAAVFNKTGSTAHLCGDMGIIVGHDRHGRQRPYIMVGIVQKSHRASSYPSWIKSRGNIIGEVSSAAYEEIVANSR